ncbi:hypothetical protein VTK26DRAFT_926 [Humicola hyalothermophila]
MAETAEDHDDLFRPESGPPTGDTNNTRPDAGHDATNTITTQPTPTITSSITAQPPKQSQPAPKNAFTELMAPKPSKAASYSPPPRSLSSKASQVIRGVWRGALAEYTSHPERFPPGVVLRVTPHTVLVRDAFPKATVHLLLLPRSEAHHTLHPHAAFAGEDGGEFLRVVRAEAAEARRLAAKELERLVGGESASNRARWEAVGKAGPAAEQELPGGRDYEREIRVGTHAHPSMAHLHVHVISRDMHSERMKHRKHYNSFNTPFFVPLEDYPLPEGDVRRQTAYQNANLGRDLVCWRCGKGFGNKFAELKRHLEEEFEAWKKE